MIEIKDIKDEQRLRQWLFDWLEENELDEEAARTVAITIAHRVAMRVLPFWWQWSLTKDAHKLDITALPVLHCSLISGVAAEIPTPEILSATTATGSITSAAAEAAIMTNTSNAAIVAADPALANNAAEAADTVAEAAYTTAYTTTEQLSTSVGLTANFAPRTITETLWDSVRSDCKKSQNGEALFSEPLWPYRNNPIEDVWSKIVADATNPEWAFWIKWYEGALKGHPQNWKMQEQIALIGPEVWEDGAVAVSERIEEIWELHRLRAEVVTLQAEKDGLFSGAATAAHRAHNQPPDIVESDFDLAREIMIIRAGLDDASHELKKDEPDKGVLGKIAKKILSAIISVSCYFGKIADTAIMAAAKVIGGGGGAMALDYIVNNGRLLQFAKDLLIFSGGG